MSASTSFDYAALLPAGLPAPAARWTGLAKYSFVGGNNDPDQVPVDGLIDAVNAVLKREGKTLATYGLASGPQGYRPLREFLEDDGLGHGLKLVHGFGDAIEPGAVFRSRPGTKRGQQPDKTRIGLRRVAR